MNRWPEILDSAWGWVRRLFGAGAPGGRTRLLRRLSGAGAVPALETLRQAAHSDPEAARFYLRQRILVADPAGAAEFYETIVLPRYPDLVLDAVNQASLVRILEFADCKAAAIHAARLFLIRYPAEAGWEVVTLTLGRLLLEGAAKEYRSEAVRHLGRVEASPAEKRQRTEAARLRIALAQIPDNQAVSAQELLSAQVTALSEDPDEEVWEAEIVTISSQSEGLQMPVVSRPRQRTVVRRPSPEEDPQPDAAHQPQARTPDGQQGLEGWKPLPMKFAPGEAGRSKPSGAGLADELSAGSFAHGQDLAGGALAGMRRLSRRAAALMPFAPSPGSEPGDGESTVYGVSPDLSAQSATLADPGTATPVGESSYGVKSAPDLPGRHSRSRISGEEPNRTFLPVLPDARPDRGSRSFSLESDAYADSPIAAGTAPSRTVRTGRRNNSAGSASPSTAARQVEAVSLQLTGEELAVVTAESLLRFSTADVFLLSYGRLRLSPRSRSHQALLQLFLLPGAARSPMAPTHAGERLVRVVLWERTCSARGCRIDGETVSAENPLGELFQALESRVSPEAVSEASPQSRAAGAQASVFGSYPEYEEITSEEVRLRLAELPGRPGATDELPSAESPSQ